MMTTPGHFLVLNIVLRPSFLALSTSERTALLNTIAAPVQEFTGAEGGVIFSELSYEPSGQPFVTFVVSIKTPGIYEAFLNALKSERVAEYFAAGGVIGDVLDAKAFDSPEDVTERILKPFLDAQQKDRSEPSDAAP